MNWDGTLVKHVAVRLWTALWGGSVVALLVLPPFAASLGPAWMVVPGLGLLIAAYWLAGLLFAAMGRRRLARLLDEATVWERAGMSREARQALDLAAATVDSFLFSPLSRQAPVRRLLSQMAHHQLAKATPDSASNAIIEAYLRDFPQDRDAAVKWLESLLAGGEVTRNAHDIAARIGSAHNDDDDIQRMLTRFYLAEGRCDFAALQTYRLWVDSAESAGDTLMDGIGDLLLAQQRADSLALDVYLNRVEGGHRDGRWLSGIAACLQVVPPGLLSHRLRERADTALADIDPVRRERMAAAFLPDTAIDAPGASAAGPRIPWSRIQATAGRAAAGLGRVATHWRSGAASLSERLRGALRSRRFKSVFKWVSAGVFAVGVGWLVLSTASHMTGGLTTPEPVPAPAAVPVTDPFTLQVAAYLQETDARRYTNQLIDQGLDAYWTRASGANTTWYQVRVSHFKTKAAARAYGEDLKNRQIIDDYYVANYSRPDNP